MIMQLKYILIKKKNEKKLKIKNKKFFVGALTKISKSLINNSQFDIVNFVIDKMAESIARWIEKELLNGSADKIEGLSTSNPNSNSCRHRSYYRR